MITHDQLVPHLTERQFKLGHKNKSWAALHEERGIRLDWRSCPKCSICPQPHVHMWVKVRTVPGTPVSYRASQRYENVVPDADFLQTLQTLRGAPPKQKRITGDTLPVPFGFAEDRFVVENGSWKPVAAIASAKLAGLVHITREGTISDDIATPDAECWFHFDCLGTMGATFDIITDGLVWYPINRQTKKVSVNLRPKKSVDLSQMGANDLALVTAAIANYMETTYGQ